MLTSEQLAFYHKNGYLALPGFVAPAEVERLRAEVQRMQDGAPARRGASQDKSGQPVDTPGDFSFKDLAKDVAGADGASSPNGNGQGQVLNRISNQLARSAVMRQAYGNPRLLACVESLYGPDFLPFAESIVLKLPDQGSPFWWHQDGNFKTGPVAERGVNFGIYLYPSTEANGCLRVIPGSHTWGQVDLDALVAKHGERLPGSIPLTAAPGDVLVHSRNLIHGSFANTSPDMRVTVYFGFHAHATVAGVYTDEHIRQRMGVIPLCVQARAASGLYADETPYVYQPLADEEPVAAKGAGAVLRAPSLSV